MRMRICPPSAISVRVTLIHNPGAGSTGEKDAVKLEKLLSRSGHKVRYRSSKEPGWKRALKKPSDLVVVAGGDGTLIHNPGAGSTGEKAAVNLEKLLSRSGHKVRYRSSKEPG